MYGMMYGVKRTTVYLPEEMKAAVERAARAEGRTEAEVIREAIGAALAGRTDQSPTVPLVAEGLGDPSLAEQVDEALAEGFGG